MVVATNMLENTEFGELSRDWELTTVGDLVARGILVKPLDGNHGNIHPKSSEYVSDGVPFVLANDIDRNGKLDLANCKFITPERASKLQKGFSYTGDVLLTHKGTVGNVAVVPTLETEYIMLTPQVTYYRVGNHQELIGPYIKHFFESTRFQTVLANLSGGGTRAYIGISKQVQLPFVLPAIEEQRAIAEVLSDVDALINALDALITKKHHIKQGTMQQLLTGKKRLPGFRGEWKDCELKDCLLANPDYGINAPGVPHASNLPTYLRITDIDDDGRFMPDDCVAVNHPKAMDYILRENEIVFARTGASVGKTYLYNPDDDELVFAGFLIRAKIDPKELCPEFFSAFTKTGLYWNWVRVMSMRSGQPGINGNEYAMLEIPLPPTVEEQETIAEILVDMDSEIAALEQKRDKTKLIKQGMMQELLTGKTRLV